MSSLRANKITDQNHLYAWLKRQGMWGDGRGEITHYFFNGGKARIPNDTENYAFNCILFRALKKSPQYVIERRTQIFKFFMDLDIRIEEDLPSTVKQTLVSFIKKEVDLFFMGSYEIIVCTRSHVGNKTGIHLVWPKITTDSKDALALRRCLIPACQKGLGNMFTNSWSEVIDKSVYEKNGFRMIGCIKGGGDISEYIPVWRVSPQGEWTELSGGVTQFLMHETSIRYFGIFKTDSRTLDSNKETGNGVGNQDEEDSLIHATHAGLQWFNMASIYKELDTIKDQIVQHTPQYANLVFKKVFKTNGKDIYFIRANSKYCRNKKGFHCSSNVYFMVTRNSIFQKCFSRKIKEGVDKQCQNYTGPRINLHWTVQRSAALFEALDLDEERQTKNQNAWMFRGL